MSKSIDKILSIEWKPVYLDGKLTTYLISRDGILLNKKSDRIIELYNIGKSNIEITNIIMSEFGLTDRRKTNLSIRDIISRYKNRLSCSSTIGHLC